MTTRQSTHKPLIKLPFEHEPASCKCLTKLDEITDFLKSIWVTFDENSVTIRYNAATREFTLHAVDDMNHSHVCITFYDMPILEKWGVIAVFASRFSITRQPLTEDRLCFVQLSRYINRSQVKREAIWVQRQDRKASMCIMSLQHIYGRNRASRRWIVPCFLGRMAL